MAWKTMSGILILHLFFFPLLGHSQSLPILNNNTDYQSLFAFKSHISTADVYGVLESWNSSSHFCNWTGITCNITKQRVTSLNLENLGLVGTISPHICNLSFLNYLNLQNNSFYGNLPTEIGKLFRLKTLILGSNQIQGRIPSSLSLCSKLNLLDLSINRLKGAIPSELGVLSNLQALSFMRNFLTGFIPPSFGNLSSLTNLILLSNTLQGPIPEGLGRLPSLINLQIGDNNISGEIPHSLINNSSLIVLAMAKNSLKGQLPSDMFTQLTSLTTLYMGGNQFSGPIPSSLGNASNLVRVDLSSNHFSGKIPLLWNLPSIQVLNLEINELVSDGDGGLDFLTSLINSTQLQVFSVATNRLTGMLPSSFGNLSRQLSLLVMGENQFEGNLPAEISNLVNLTMISLEYNSFTGSIPTSIGSMPNLQNLYLHQNKFSGEIPASLGNLTKLSELSLRHNLLEGAIPSSLGNFRHLQVLDLSDNKLNGTIPVELLRIPNFAKLLNLSLNSLSGPIPVDIGKLKTIQGIDLSSNLLSGQIPGTIGDCSSLFYLNLSKNFFQGSIPDSIASLKGMEYMDLSSNNLSGEIPTSLESLLFLQVLDLSMNQLEGQVPTEGTFKNSTVVSLTGNPKLCGGVPNLGLPKCPVTKKHSGGSKLKLALGLSLGFAALIAAVVLLWLSSRKRNSSKPAANDVVVSFDGDHKSYTYHELKVATKNFSSDHLIGEGSFGYVYKGSLSDGTVAAIKVFKMEQHGASKSFLAECEALRNVRHRNLVRIISVCSAGDFKALILPFMPKRSLDWWLHHRTEPFESSSLDMRKRLDIVQDIALAMEYLHHDCEKPIVHCDLKPSNILLDENMVVHVADFGLARILLEKRPFTSSLGLKGSIGYMAPEYGTGAGVSIQGDVYSFGILLLELFTRKKPTNEMFTGDLDLQKWVSTELPDQLEDIVDHELLEKEMRPIYYDCLVTMLNIGLMCTMMIPEKRPTMGEVSVMIKNAKVKLRN